MILICSSKFGLIEPLDLSLLRELEELLLLLLRLLLLFLEFLELEEELYGKHYLLIFLSSWGSHF